MNEYGILRAVVNKETANTILAQVKLLASESGIEDACLLSQDVSRVLTYNHHPRVDRRRNSKERQAA